MCREQSWKTGLEVGIGDQFWKGYLCHPLLDQEKPREMVSQEAG